MASVTDAELQALADTLTADDIPSKLRCARCSKLNLHAWRLPCCENSVCASCFDELQSACPVCSHEPVSKDVCKPHSSLRKTASVWLKTQHKKRSEASKATVSSQVEPPPADGSPAKVADTVDAPHADVQPAADSQPPAGPADVLHDATDLSAQSAPALSTSGEPDDKQPQEDENEQADAANDREEEEEDEEDDDDDVVIRIDEVAQPSQENNWDLSQGGNERNGLLQENGISNASDGFSWQQMANMSNMMAMNGMQGFSGFPGMMGMTGMSLDPSMMGQNFFGMGMNAMNAGMGFGGWNPGMSMNGMGDGFGNGQYSGGSYMHHPGRTVHQSQYYGNSYHQNRFRGRGAHRGFGRGRYGYQGPGQGQHGQYESSGPSMNESMASSSGQEQAKAAEAVHSQTGNDSQYATSDAMDVDTGRSKKEDGSQDQTHGLHQDASQGMDGPVIGNGKTIERGVSPPGPNVPLGPAAQFAPGRGRGAFRGAGKIIPGAARGRGGTLIPIGPGLGVEGAPTGPKAFRNGVQTATNRGHGVGVARGAIEAAEPRPAGRSGDTNTRKLSQSPEADSRARARHERENLAESKRSRRRGSSTESDKHYHHSHRERVKDRSSRHERERSRERRKRKHRSRSPGSDAERRHGENSGRETRHERRRERERDRDRDKEEDRRSHPRSRRDRSASGGGGGVGHTATSRRSCGDNETELSIRKSQNLTVSGASELDEARRAIKEEKPDIDQHALEREARNRERLLKEQQRRGLADMESSNRKRSYDDGAADAPEHTSSKHRRRARDGHHGGRSRRGGPYRDEKDIMDRVERSEKIREAGRWQ